MVFVFSFVYIFPQHLLIPCSELSYHCIGIEYFRERTHDFIFVDDYNEETHIAAIETAAVWYVFVLSLFWPVVKQQMNRETRENVQCIID